MFFRFFCKLNARACSMLFAVFLAFLYSWDIQNLDEVTMSALSKDSGYIMAVFALTWLITKELTRYRWSFIIIFCAVSASAVFLHEPPSIPGAIAVSLFCGMLTTVLVKIFYDGFRALQLCWRED